MGCPAGFVLDPLGAVCIPEGSQTDPSFYQAPPSGDILFDPTGGGDIIPPQGGPSLCQVGEIDPMSGDTIASCASNSGAGTGDPAYTPTPASPGIWNQIFGVAGAFIGGLTKFGTTGQPAGVPVGSKRCPNGQVVFNSQACPGASTASVLGSSGSTTMILLVALAVILFIALRK